MKSRLEQAIIALYDFGTSQGATAVSVKAQMRKAGFTNEEIAQAAEKIGPNQ